MFLYHGANKPESSMTLCSEEVRPVTVLETDLFDVASSKQLSSYLCCITFDNFSNISIVFSHTYISYNLTSYKASYFVTKRL